MRAVLLVAVFVMLAGPAWALPDGYIDPSNATVKTGQLQVDSNQMATVNVTVTNLSKQTLELVAVSCTALINDEPIETNSTLPNGIAPSQKAYASVNFFKVKGRKDATASCRIEYIKVS